MVLMEGGVNIEEVVEENLDVIVCEYIDFVFGLYFYQVCKVVFEVGIFCDVVFDVVLFFMMLYDFYELNDVLDIEINFVMIMFDCDIVVVDVVMNIDDDVLFCYDDFVVMEEDVYENDFEVKVGEYGFDYVCLLGNVGIIGNGVGFVMMMFDFVDYFGGEFVNFFDIGGGVKVECVVNVLDMVFFDENVDFVVFNIFGGIICGDEVVKGINEVLESFDEIFKLVVVCFVGMNVEEGMEILNMDFVQVEGMLEDVVQCVVENVQEVF